MIYTVLKQSGTYAETLEWLGFSYFLEKLCRVLPDNATQITLGSTPDKYTVTINRDINQNDLIELHYFWVLPFIRNKADAKVPDEVPNAELRDYPNQKRIRDEQRVQREAIQKDKSLSVNDRKQKMRELSLYQASELSERKDLDYDVYSIISSNNPYPSYLKLFTNFSGGKSDFSQLVWEILSYYTTPGSITKSKIKSLIVKVTAQQLYAPNQGKGLNRDKADGPKAENRDGFWISETMKVLGALQAMFIQKVKVGQKYDIKINVPEFKNIDLQQITSMMSGFKRTLRSESAIKVDILNVLNFCESFILNSPQYKDNSNWKRTKVSNSISGLHAVLQKSLGKQPTVVNMSFFGVPTFIEYTSLEDAQHWITILGDQANIIRGIVEQGNSIDGLQAYRSFLSGSDLNSFFRFSNFYATYLTHELSAERYYVKPFKTEHLNQFFYSMSTETLKLGDIVTNPGFISIARAIRRSTISLQYTPKRERKFNIRYGLAQELQVKSKSTSDLATFIGEFVASYNAETARYEELRRNNSTDESRSARAVVKDAELNAFYNLLDKNPSRIIGALLGSYGFALTAKEQPAPPQIDNQPETVEDNETEDTDLDF